MNERDLTEAKRRTQERADFLETLSRPYPEEVDHAQQALAAAARCLRQQNRKVFDIGHRALWVMSLHPMATLGDVVAAMCSVDEILNSVFDLGSPVSDEPVRLVTRAFDALKRIVDSSRARAPEDLK